MKVCGIVSDCSVKHTLVCLLLQTHKYLGTYSGEYKYDYLSDSNWVVAPF